MKTSKNGTNAKRKAGANPAKNHAPASRDSKQLFRDGSSYHAVFTSGKRGFTSRQELADRVGKAIRKAARLTRIVVDVLANPKHKTNGGRVKLVTKGDRMFLVAVKK